MQYQESQAIQITDKVFQSQCTDAHYLCALKLSYFSRHGKKDLEKWQYRKKEKDKKTKSEPIRKKKTEKTQPRDKSRITLPQIKTSSKTAIRKK